MSAEIRRCCRATLEQIAILTGPLYRPSLVERFCGILQAEGYSYKSNQSLMGRECCFIVIGLFDFNLPANTVSVQGGELRGFHKGVDVLYSSWYGARVPFLYCIQLPIVDAKTYRSIFLGANSTGTVHSVSDRFVRQ